MAAEQPIDPEPLFDDLVESGVLNIDPDTEEVTLTEDFDSTFQIYVVSYETESDEDFHSTLASVFGLEDEQTAAERAEELEVTREELAAFLALRSHFEEPPSTDRLAVMASMVVNLGVGSPVPDAMEEVTDETYQDFLDDHGDVVIMVWRTHCDPCDAVKRNLDAIMASAPAEVTFAGIDGEESIDFRKEFEVEAAPTTLVFRGGELAEMIRGRAPVERFEDVFEQVYA